MPVRKKHVLKSRVQIRQTSTTSLSFDE